MRGEGGKEEDNRDESHGGGVVVEGGEAEEDNALEERSEPRDDIHQGEQHVHVVEDIVQLGDVEPGGWKRD